METIKIKTGEQVKVVVKISSDANVGSNVSLNDVVIKKSITTNFTVPLGVIDDIDKSTLSVVSNFFVHSKIDAIIETTIVEITVSSETTSVSVLAEKVKLNAMLFMAFVVLKLEKA
ncbi:hypothetical protein OS188_09280 [Xanthomarina sp. F1114]|uniref:hypothetical protein n=1 Tax=Xanthomarina sp. F1114 TaxID=2996019 RepID=UPI00225DFA0B|nr:hypothetical protein [Xanthomarina sp. F1114]MCX7548144.1 hypothetical protein [Xanthomarina sp. F1114]